MHDNAQILHHPLIAGWPRCTSLNDLNNINKKSAKLIFYAVFVSEDFLLACVRTQPKITISATAHSCIYALCKLRNEIIQEQIICGLIAVVFGKQWKWKNCKFILANYDQQQPKSQMNRYEIIVFLFCSNKSLDETSESGKMRINQKKRAHASHRRISNLVDSSCGYH